MGGGRGESELQLRVPRKRENKVKMERGLLAELGRFHHPRLRPQPFLNALTCFPHTLIFPFTDKPSSLQLPITLFSNMSLSSLLRPSLRLMSLRSLHPPTSSFSSYLFINNNINTNTTIISHLMCTTRGMSSKIRPPIKMISGRIRRGIIHCE